MAETLEFVDLLARVIGDDWTVPITVDDDSPSDFSDWTSIVVELRYGPTKAWDLIGTTRTVEGAGPIYLDGDEDLGIGASDETQLIVWVPAATTSAIDPECCGAGRYTYLEVSAISESLGGGRRTPFRFRIPVSDEVAVEDGGS